MAAAAEELDNAKERRRQSDRDLVKWMARLTVMAFSCCALILAVLVYALWAGQRAQMQRDQQMGQLTSGHYALIETIAKYGQRIHTLESEFNLHKNKPMHPPASIQWNAARIRLETFEARLDAIEALSRAETKE